MSPTVSPKNIQEHFEGFQVEAPSLYRLFIEGGTLLSQKLVTVADFGEQERKSIELKQDSPHALMNAWLGVILNLFENEKFLCSRIILESFDGKEIKATLWGETYEGVRHGTPNGVVKVICDAVTTSEATEGFIAKVSLTHKAAGAA